MRPEGARGYQLGTNILGGLQMTLAEEVSVGRFGDTPCVCRAWLRRRDARPRSKSAIERAASSRESDSRRSVVRRIGWAQTSVARGLTVGGRIVRHVAAEDPPTDRLAETIKRAAELAKLVPESLQEAAFNRAFDQLTGTGRAGKNDDLSGSSRTRRSTGTTRRGAARSTPRARTPKTQPAC